MHACKNSRPRCYTECSQEAVVPGWCDADRNLVAFARHLKPGVGYRYVCLYDVEDRILLRRVQISSNRSLDGVLDQLNSKEMTDAGPAQLLDDAASDEDELLPPTTAGAAPFPGRLNGRNHSTVPPGHGVLLAVAGSL